MDYEGSIVFILSLMTCLNAGVYGRTQALHEDDSHLHGDSEGCSQLNPLQVPVCSAFLRTDNAFSDILRLLLSSHSLTAVDVSAEDRNS
jgi:hypothetical protein